MYPLIVLYGVGLFVVAWTSTCHAASWDDQRIPVLAVRRLPDNLQCVLAVGVVATAAGGSSIDSRAGTPGWVIVPLGAGLILAAWLPHVVHNIRLGRVRTGRTGTDPTGH